jgi:hypothetical protein
MERSWAENSYPNLSYFNEVGHFAAWEEPELFSVEVRARLQVGARTTSLPPAMNVDGN